jgi:adenylyltransferase/sulfurtransferase
MKEKTYKTKPVPAKKRPELNSSQQKIAGFDLKTYRSAKVLLIGAGAIGSHTAQGLTRKGIKCLDIWDDDTVELKNLTRQLFHLSDVGKNKAVSLAKNMSKEGFFESTIRGYPYRFQEALEGGTDLSGYSAVICAVDNNPTRIAASAYCLSKSIPLVMSAVSRDGIQMYCAIQEPGQACFGCLMPQAVNNHRYQCNLPGIIDINQVVSGVTVYALDTVLMQRNREWNLRMFSLDGSIPDSSLYLSKNDNCPLCRQARGKDS